MPHVTGLKLFEDDSTVSGTELIAVIGTTAILVVNEPPSGTSIRTQVYIADVDNDLALSSSWVNTSTLAYTITPWGLSGTSPTYPGSIITDGTYAYVTGSQQDSSNVHASIWRIDPSDGSNTLWFDGNPVGSKNVRTMDAPVWHDGGMYVKTVDEDPVVVRSMQFFDGVNPPVPVTSTNLAAAVPNLSLVQGRSIGALIYYTVNSTDLVTWNPDTDAVTTISNPLGLAGAAYIATIEYVPDTDQIVMFVGSDTAGQKYFLADPADVAGTDVLTLVAQTASSGGPGYFMYHPESMKLLAGMNNNRFYAVDLNIDPTRVSPGDPFLLSFDPVGRIHVSSTGNTYMFLQDGGIMKATGHPSSDSDFSLVASSDIDWYLNSTQVGDVLHIISKDSSSSTTLRYSTFNMATDALVVNKQTLFTSTGTTTLAADLAVRSNGEVVAIFQGNTITSTLHIVYAIRSTGGVWATPVSFASSAATAKLAIAILPGDSGRLHFVYTISSSTNDPLRTAGNQVATLSSTNVITVSASTLTQYLGTVSARSGSLPALGQSRIVTGGTTFTSPSLAATHTLTSADTPTLPATEYIYPGNVSQRAHQGQNFVAWDTATTPNYHGMWATDLAPLGIFRATTDTLLQGDTWNEYWWQKTSVWLAQVNLRCMVRYERLGSERLGYIAQDSVNTSDYYFGEVVLTEPPARTANDEVGITDSVSAVQTINRTGGYYLHQVAVLT